MAKDIVVNITQAKATGNIGFGVPLIVVGMASTSKEFKEYTELSDLTDDGYTTDSEVYKQMQAIRIQDANGRPKSVAVCSGTGKITETLATLGDKSFRQIIPIFGEEDDSVKELATYVETTDKMLFVRVSSSTELEDIKGMDRTFAIVHPDEENIVLGALVGATAGRSAGSFTYKDMVLKGVTPQNLKDSEVKKIHDAGGICILKKAGDIVTSEGKVVSGEYADVIDSMDYVIQNIEYKLQKMKNNNPKIAYDNSGISMLESEVMTVLATAAANGMIAVDDDGAYIYSTNFASRSEVAESDRASRVYNGGKFSFELAGAIHEATINGTISA